MISNMKLWILAFVGLFSLNLLITSQSHLYTVSAEPLRLISKQQSPFIIRIEKDDGVVIPESEQEAESEEIDHTIDYTNKSIEYDESPSLTSKHGSEPAHPPLNSEEFFFALVVTIFLVLLGGVFAGLTIGIMSLDATNLNILITSGSESEKKYAKTIMPIRRHGHWVLSTLLLGNVLINETLPILFDRIVSGGVFAIVISTSLVVIFGEIIPNAICARHGLAISAYTAPFIKLCMWLFSPVAYPVARLLDFLLGHSEGTIYARAELKTLVHLHQQGHPGGELIADEVGIIGGVLDLMDKNVEQIMTPIDDVFSMDIQDIIDTDMMKKIIAKGHSRVPVFQKSQSNIVAILLTKKLLGYNVSQQRKVKDFPLMYLPIVDSKTNLFDMLNFFQEGRSHMAAVAGPQINTPLAQNEVHSPSDETPLLESILGRNPSHIRQTEPKGQSRSIIGIITMEDVIEEIIGEEIIDETDEYVDVHTKVPVKRGGTNQSFINIRNKVDVQSPKQTENYIPPSSPVKSDKSEISSSNAIPISSRKTSASSGSKKPRRDKYQIVNINSDDDIPEGQVQEWTDQYFGSLKGGPGFGLRPSSAPEGTLSDHYSNIDEVDKLEEILEHNDLSETLDLNRCDSADTAARLSNRVRRAFDEHKDRLTVAGWVAEPLNKDDSRTVMARKKKNDSCMNLHSNDETSLESTPGPSRAPSASCIHGTSSTDIADNDTIDPINVCSSELESEVIPNPNITTAIMGAARTGLTGRSISSTRPTQASDIIQHIVNQRVAKKATSPNRNNNSNSQ